MSQIFRIIKPEIMQICRFYGSYRNLHTHYETLRIAPNATQKDIRQAFIKLSKEMHPDTSKNSSHADFVKLNEAYKILSKEYSRRVYDMELSNRRDGRPVRVMYYDPSAEEWNRRPTMHPHDPNDDNYYGIKGIKKVSNLTIALLCLVFSAFGLVVQIIVINKSVVSQREMLVAQTIKHAETYRKIREEADSKDNAQRIADFEQNLVATDADVGVGLQR